MMISRYSILTVALIIFSTFLTPAAAEWSPHIPHLIGNTNSPTISVYTDEKDDVGGVRVIFCLWEDGTVFWSKDTVLGGPPYLEGKIGKKEIDQIISTIRTNDLYEKAYAKRNKAVLFYDQPESHIVFTRPTFERTLSRTLYNDDPTNEYSTAYQKVLDTVLALVPTEKNNRKETNGIFRLLKNNYHEKKMNGIQQVPRGKKLTPPAFVKNAPLLHIEAETAQPVAVYFMSGGTHNPSTIVSVWQDGRIVWGDSLIFGGPTYYEANIGSENVEKWLKGLENSGVFQEQCLDSPNLVDPKVLGHTIEIIYGAKYLHLESQHQTMELSGRSILTADGRLDMRGDRTNKEWLSDEPECYQIFRSTWDDITQSMLDLIPKEKEKGKSLGRLKWK